MKNFILKSSIYCVPFFIGMLFYVIFIENNLSGDIGRLGKIPFGSEYQSRMTKFNPDTIFVKDYDASEIELIKNISNKKIVTIGDSFSQQEKLGYQQCIGQLNMDTMINISGQWYLSPEQKAIILLNNCAFDNVEYVIIESVERATIGRLSNLDFSVNEICSKLDNISNNNKPHNDVLFRFMSWIRLRLGKDNPIKKAELKNKLFSHNTYGSDLFFYQEDLNFTKYSESQVVQAKDNLEKLFIEFDKKNVKLIYVIATNKYNLFYDFIEDNSYPEDNTMELLSSSNKVVNTKKLLLPYIQRGEKDIYLVNDTHWSYKASEIVGVHLYDIINNSNKVN